MSHNAIERKGRQREKELKFQSVSVSTIWNCISYQKKSCWHQIIIQEKEKKNAKKRYHSETIHKKCKNKGQILCICNTV